MNGNNQGNVQPIYILPEDSKRETGKSAQRNNILAAKLVGETVRTTLGPKGMDKMLVDALGDIIVTNDGVTILKEMNIEHPAGKMLVEIAKTQENEVGDGTTTAVILAAELLKRSEELLDDKIHPTVIINGYRLAASKAIEVVKDYSEKIDINDKKTLLNIAGTAMTGKGAENAKTKLSEIVVSAVLDVMSKEEDRIDVDVDDIKIEKVAGANVEDTTLIEGILLDKERVHAEMPKKVEEPKILLIDSPIELRDNEIDTKIQITDPARMQEFMDLEEQMIKKIAQKIIDSGANVVFCQKGIDDLAQHILAKNCVFAVRRVKKGDMEKIAKATNARIATSIDSIDVNDLGKAGVVKEQRIGDDPTVMIGGCKGAKSVTILVRGGTDHVIDEVARALEDSIGVVSASVKDGKIVPGAGAPEIELVLRLKEFADTLKGREQLAVEAFAKSLEVIPATLAENAGLDPIDVITSLKSSHKKNEKTGINVFTGKLMDPINEGVIEPLRIKTQAISSAAEVAIMILRIDDVIAAGVEPQGPPMDPSQGMM
ncbi:thermosome subunit [Candidatus Woesearchaeota archaeon]|nr:MAG: thermosome subunit [Candidatus Woesearchaeota archaeon]